MKSISAIVVSCLLFLTVSLAVPVSDDGLVFEANEVTEQQKIVDLGSEVETEAETLESAASVETTDAPVADKKESMVKKVQKFIELNNRQCCTLLMIEISLFFG